MPFGEQCVHEAIVKIEPPRFDLARALRKHARPGNAQTISIDAKLREPFDVFLPAIVMIAGNVGVTVADNYPRATDEHVPHTLAATRLA